MQRHLNDLDLAVSHLERMVKDIVTSRSLGQTFLDSEIAIVSEEIRRFDDAVRILRNLIQVSATFIGNRLTLRLRKGWSGTAFQPASATTPSAVG